MLLQEQEYFGFSSITIHVRSIAGRHKFLADAFPGVRGDAFPGGETESEEAGELLPASGGGRLGRGHGDGELAAAL